MSGRLLSLGLPIALLATLAGAIVAACYTIPTPSCGFLCGPNDACPDSYACATDHYCHLIGSPANLVCATADAGTPDAPLDAPLDARVNDAPPDATIDAPPDATIDAPPDVTVDAPLDATVDAPPDA